MGTATLIALMVIIVIILFYVIHYLHKNDQLPDGIFRDSIDRMKNSANTMYDSYFTSPKSLYTRIVGYENDENTKMALDKASQKDDMYTKNEKKGNFSKNKLNDATTNSFYLASMYQFNVASNEPTLGGRMNARSKAAKQYKKAINRITANPVAVVQHNHDVEEPPVEFIIDRAEAFYDDYADQLTALRAAGGDADIQELLFPDFNQVRHQVRAARLATAATETKEQKEKRRKRRKRVSKNATQKQILQDNYYEERDLRSDPQNVHESQVVDDMTNIYRNILVENDRESLVGEPIHYTMGDIKFAIKHHEFGDPGKRSRALKVFNKIEQGNSISNLKAGEDEIILNVWRRIHSPDNAENRESLKASLMDALAEGMDKNHFGEYKEVCAGGRTSRVLGSLTLLDNNDQIAAPMKTKEIMRNEIFAKTYKIIQNELENAPKMVSNAYNGIIPEEEVPPELNSKVEALEDHMRDVIAQTIKDDYPNSKNLDNLILDAQAGV